LSLSLSQGHIDDKNIILLLKGCHKITEIAAGLFIRELFRKACVGFLSLSEMNICHRISSCPIFSWGFGEKIPQFLYVLTSLNCI
jgi:hypothetical protein